MLSGGALRLRIQKLPANQLGFQQSSGSAEFVDFSEVHVFAHKHANALIAFSVKGSVASSLLDMLYYICFPSDVAKGVGCNCSHNIVRSRQSCGGA
jgi:hypothetical protein